MGKISAWWLLLVLVIAIIAVAIYFNLFYIPLSTITHRKRKHYDIVTFKLPNSVDPKVFGPRQWEARHYLDSIIPCSSCRSHAMPLGVFVHDILNLSTDQRVFNKENWQEHITLINKLHQKFYNSQ